jgi:hypothetical protein
MRFLAMARTPGGSGYGASARPPVAQNVSLLSLVGNQESRKRHHLLGGYDVANRP